MYLPCLLSHLGEIRYEEYKHNVIILAIDQLNAQIIVL